MSQEKSGPAREDVLDYSGLPYGPPPSSNNGNGDSSDEGYSNNVYLDNPDNDETIAAFNRAQKELERRTRQQRAERAAYEERLRTGTLLPGEENGFKPSWSPGGYDEDGLRVAMSSSGLKTRNPARRRRRKKGAKKPTSDGEEVSTTTTTTTTTTTGGDVVDDPMNTSSSSEDSEDPWSAVEDSDGQADALSHGDSSDEYDSYDDDDDEPLDPTEDPNVIAGMRQMKLSVGVPRKMGPEKAQEWRESGEDGTAADWPKNSPAKVDLVSVHGTHQGSGAAGDDDVEEVMRGVIAKADIAPGITIVAERPIAAVVEDSIDDVCSWCFERSVKISRCSACRIEGYCSTDCQREAWKGGHKQECKALVNIAKREATDKTDARPTHTVRLIARVLKKAVEDPEVLRRALYLTHNWEDVDVKQRMIWAAAANVAAMVAFDEETPTEFNLKTALGLIARQACNAYSICDEELTPVGSAYYTRLGLFNHACDPNAVAIWGDKGEVKVRSIVPIKAGEEITIGYVDAAIPRGDRRGLLLDQYGFLCSCSRCSTPLEQSRDRFATAWRCVDCSDISDHLNVTALILESTPCPDCGRKPGPDAVSSREVAENEIKEFRRNTRAGEPMSMKQAKIAAEAAGAYGHPYCTIMMQTLGMWMNSCFECNELKYAVEPALRLLFAYQAVYPPGHPLIALQTYRVAKLMLGAGLPDTKSMLEKSLKLINVTHGPNHWMTKDCEEKLVDLHRGMRLH